MRELMELVGPPRRLTSAPLPFCLMALVPKRIALTAQIFWVFCQTTKKSPRHRHGSERLAHRHLHLRTHSSFAMATIVPPPSKRQRREDLERTQIQQDVTAASGPAGSFKARFLDGDGKQVCDVIEVPLADASEKNLSLLLNTLLARVRTEMRPALLLPRDHGC